MARHFYVLVLLLLEDEAVVAHGTDNGQASQLVASSPQLCAAGLEALFNADTDTANGTAGLFADIKQSLHGLAVGKKIVQNQNFIIGGKKFFGQCDIVIPAVGVGVHLGGENISINVFTFCFFGKYNRHIKMTGRHAGNGNAGSLDGENLVDTIFLKNAVKFGADLVQQFYIKLVIQKAVDL